MTSPAINSVKLIARAYEFALRKRASTGKPYDPYAAVHLVETGRLLAEVSNGQDPILVAAGVLHDILERTNCTPERLEERFGKTVAGIVTELTVPIDQPEKDRMRIKALIASDRSIRAKMVLMASLIGEVANMTGKIVPGQEEDAIIDRLTWAAQIVTACRPISPALGEIFDRAYAAAIERLSKEPLLKMA